MIPKPIPLLLGALLSLAGGCAHERRAADAGSVSVVWPPAPERPRVRLAQILTVAVPREAHRSWWRTFLSLLTGAEESESRDAHFARPFGVAFAADGALIVSDPDAAAVLRFGPSGAFAAELTCTNLPWQSPMGLTVSPAGEVYVADGARGAVVRWTPSGCTAIGTGTLVRPTGVALADGKVFVADPPSHRLVAFSPDGRLAGTWGTRGEKAGEFNFPTDVAAGPDGSLWVVDALNFRIAHLSGDGAWLGSIGEAGESGAGLARPKCVHVDARSRVYVSDAQRDVILVFSVDGSLDYVMGEPGADRGRFAHPSGIDVHDDRLVVADSQNRRIQIFEILGERT